MDHQYGQLKVVKLTEAVAWRPPLTARTTTVTFVFVRIAGGHQFEPYFVSHFSPFVCV